MDSRPSIALLEREKALWCLLADAIERAQQDLLDGRMANLMRALEEQVGVCVQLSHLRRVIGDLVDDSKEAPAMSSATTITDLETHTTSETSASDSGRTALLQQLCAVRNRVRHLNRVQAELLQRARRSLYIAKHLRCESPTVKIYSLPLQHDAQAKPIYTAGPQE